VAGPELTERELHLATVGWKPEKRRPGKSIPVNIIGGYRFLNVTPHDIKLAAIPLDPDTPVSPDSPPLAPSLPEVCDKGDPLDIPAFLVRSN
jgi:hypothetical protein